MELNEGIAFQSLTKEQRDTFYPMPAPVLTRMDLGKRLWKWAGPGPILINPKKGTISEYWAPWDSMDLPTMHVPGFVEFRKRHPNRGGEVGRQREAARSLFAVTEQWSEMASLLVGELKQPVWGFVGKARYQSKFKDPAHPREQDNVFFIGGEYQIVISGLTLSHIKKL